MTSDHESSGDADGRQVGAGGPGSRKWAAFAVAMLGRRLGRPWLLRRGARLGFHRDRIEAVDAFFKRHGGKAVLIGRFIGFLRALAPFVAGSSRMPYGRFLAYNVAGAILWTVACVFLGYFLGAAWPIVEKWLAVPASCSESSSSRWPRGGSAAGIGSAAVGSAARPGGY